MTQNIPDEDPTDGNDDSDLESYAGGDVSGLSELGSSLSSCSGSSTGLSKADSWLSRLAMQLEDVKLFQASTPQRTPTRWSEGLIRSPCSSVSNVSRLSELLKAPQRTEVTNKNDEDKDAGDDPRTFPGNGKNADRVLPGFVPQLYISCKPFISICFNSDPLNLGPQLWVSCLS